LRGGAGVITIKRRAAAKKSFPFLAAIILFAACALRTAAQENETRPNSSRRNASQAQLTENANAIDRPSPQRRDPRYRLCASDVVALTFPLTPEFNQTVTVQPDGFVSLIGARDVHLEGQTTQESVELIKTAYSKTLHDPIISMELKEFNKPSFIVSGQVNRGGKYDLRGFTTASQAIAIAGGFNEAAKHSQVLLFRRVNDNWYEVKSLNLKRILRGRDVNEDLEIRSGDLLYVTRESDILRCPDGRLFSPRALNQLLKQSSSLRFCQFVHDRPERVVVRAVASNGHAAEEAADIRSRLQELVGPGLRVTAELAAEPISRPGGKIPLIVNQAAT
ncbi:MAG: polysaccharide biosynthesis/export family protein, partial [Candidatus Acidiferrales bacterium]